MSVQLPPSCPHDIGPGTTVCLRCRQAERQAALARQQRILGFGAVAVVVAALLGTAAVGAMRGTRHAPDAAAETVTLQGETTAPVPGAAQESAPATSAVATPSSPSVASATSPATPAGLPVLKIGEGLTPLHDGIAVERNGDQAVVSFDTPLARTRRRDKVEQVVRTTLPVLYGSVADSALARIPEGRMSEGDLLTDVVPRGIRIPLATGAILLALETRPGQDGPLVVRYRARVLQQ